MSELIQKNDDRATIRWKLLTGASALVLIASSHAMADDGTDHPVLWIELGGNADAITGIDGRFTAPFLTQTPTPTPYLSGSPIDLQRPSRYTFGGEASLTFQPEDSDWVFAASVRYGRSNNKRSVHHQSQTAATVSNPKKVVYELFFPGSPSKWSKFPDEKYYTAQKFADTTIGQSERHLVVDFQAGKDVGLGMFGHSGNSILSAGVRMARFVADSEVTIRAKPNVTFYYNTRKRFGHTFQYPKSKWATYYLQGQAERSFHGIGPSLSWSASAPLAGNEHDGELSLDWGVNAALLFGRQTAKTSHHTTARDFGVLHYYYFTTSAFNVRHKTHYVTRYPHNPAAQIRSRNVTVANIGANIGISYSYQDAKLSFGYRTDNFFGAMDTGIDAAKKSNLTFNGPYASISIGLGD